LNITAGDWWRDVARFRKFYLTKNVDLDNKYLQALLDAGYTNTDLDHADFLFDDCAHGSLLERQARRHPYFIIPHTPQSWFFWDYPAHRVAPVKCNFVNGNAAVAGMKAYGYLHRVEAVGFSRCDVREFTPTTGNNLLVIPAHPTRKGIYSQPGYVQIVLKMIGFIISNRSAFGKVDICWNENIGSEMMQEARRKSIDFIATNPYVDKNPLKRMIERMEQADLVMGCGTAGCVSVAMGRPTVFFSETGIPHLAPNRPALKSHLYLDSLRFPLMAENMRIDEILKLRTAKNPRVEYWKLENIGGQFDANKFIRIVNEFV
jgi:hypothetical protein